MLGGPKGREGKPLVFGQTLLKLLALLPAPDRSGQPVARNCFGPHSACPCLLVAVPSGSFEQSVGTRTVDL